MEKATIFVLFIFGLLGSPGLNAQRVFKDLGVNEEHVLSTINKLRAKGCNCGQMYYPPAKPLVWNETLEKSAMSHAMEMHKHNFFSHRSMRGEDVGERLDRIGYKWQYAGENLAEGQDSYDEAMKDWIESPIHCKMLMNENMTEIGVSRYGHYWVQHFGKVMPPKTKRINVRYSEG